MSPALAPPFTIPQIAVSAAIFRDGKVLLVRRARQPAQNIWTLPGGRVELGETLEQALRREIREETALSIEFIGLAGYREMLPEVTAGRGHFVIMSFAAFWTGGDVQLNDELHEFRWCAPDAVKGIPMTEGLPEIVQAGFALLPSNYRGI